MSDHPMSGAPARSPSQPPTPVEDAVTRLRDIQALLDRVAKPSPDPADEGDPPPHRRRRLLRRG